MANWGKHITLIFIFWLFDNRQPLVLFPQPSNRPYLHIAGLIDFSPERMHYSQVINCLKLFLNENAGNLRCSFLNGVGGRTISKLPVSEVFFPSWLIPSSSAPLRTSRDAHQNQGPTLFMSLRFFAAYESFFSPLPPVLVPCYPSPSHPSPASSSPSI